MSSESEDSNISEEQEMMSSDEGEEEEGERASDSDDAPESVSFGQSKQDALENISMALQETRRLKDEQKEKRRTRHELYKKQKQNKIDLSSVKLPDSVLAKIAQLDESQKTKPTNASSSRVGSRISEEDSNDDRKIDEGEDYIPLEEDSNISEEQEMMSSDEGEEEEGERASDSDDAPESVSFGQSKQDALENISMALQETRRLKDEQKEKRRTRHELYKKQKQNKIDLSSVKLPDSVLAKIAQLDESQKTKPTNASSSRVGSRISEEDSNDDRKIDEGEDYIPLEGFQAVPISEVKLKAPPGKETALEFLQKHMYGGRINRESVDKHISRLNKRQHQPALHFTKSGAQKKQKKGRRRRKRGKN